MTSHNSAQKEQVHGRAVRAAHCSQVLEQENQQGMPLRLAELQVLAELVRERRATTPELAGVVQRTGAETRNVLDAPGRIRPRARL